MTEEDLRHTQHNDSLSDTADIRDRTTLSVLDTPLDSIPEEPTNEPPESLALRSDKLETFLIQRSLHRMVFICRVQRSQRDLNRMLRSFRQIVAQGLHLQCNHPCHDWIFLVRFQFLLGLLRRPIIPRGVHQLSCSLLMMRSSNLQNVCKLSTYHPFLLHLK